MIVRLQNKRRRIRVILNFLVMLLLWQALMNGRIPSPYHRVRVTEKKKTRYSAALFAYPKAGYIIDSPKELVDEKHPRAFKPFDFVDLFNFYHTEAGRSAQSTLQAFCGISAGT